MDDEKVYKMSFSKVYNALVQKAVRKGRSEDEVQEVICWLTGYTKEKVAYMEKSEMEYGAFFQEAPNLNPNRKMIKVVICGVWVEEMDPSLMQEIRYLDKLIDELAKGKSMKKILRSEAQE